ncbi:helix-turn-helix domain-containing protein [Actinomadura sp. ATCC 31491]|uniref:Helix-turn-helix domain-containing protein n=1 Tax=Actinomadura luzonensis TaxID=2805427 RepID=A0ABT0G4X6_9ACTN|nr:helix-turn-helix domain-containing protein [Actinomadura luzonensis]MCK2219625.1 helix-turn-helix domain-containing protein [Actinomadura luzonensis]
MFRGDRLPVRPDPGLTVLTAGCWVRLQTGTAPTTRRVIDLAAPGDLAHVLHRDAVVLTRGRVLHVASELVPIALSNMPGVSRLVQHLQAERQRFADHLHAAGRLDIDVRLARLLLALLHRFGERRCGGLNVLAPPLSQADLAAWIGASESSVWRALCRWRRDGLVHTGYSTLALLNAKEIRKVADSPALPYTGIDASAAGSPPARRVTAGLDLDADLPPGL